MDKQLKTELRKLLTGRTIRDEEGWLIAVPEGNYLIYHGVADSTGFRKIKLREERVQVDADNEQAFHLVFGALQDMGILVNMETKPDALCALCRLYLTKAVIICVELEREGVLLVQVYTGRSILAGICCRRVIKNFIKNLNKTQD